MIGNSNARSIQRFLHPKNGSPEEWFAEQGKFNAAARLRICSVSGIRSTSDTGSFCKIVPASRIAQRSHSSDASARSSCAATTCF